MKIIFFFLTQFWPVSCICTDSHSKFLLKISCIELWAITLQEENGDQHSSLIAQVENMQISGNVSTGFPCHFTGGKTCWKKLFYFENVFVKSYSATYKCFTGDRDLPLLMCFIGASSVQILKGMQCKLKTTYLHLTVSSQVTDSSTGQCQPANIKLSREVGKLVFNPAQLTY